MRRRIYRSGVRAAGAIRSAPTLSFVRFCTNTLVSTRVGYMIQLGFDPNNLRRVSRRQLRPLIRVVRGPLGERLEIDLNDHIGYNIFMTGHFDTVPSAMAILVDQVASGGVYVDVGAHVGTTCVGLVAQGLKVIAVEPSGSNAGRLLRSAALNEPGQLVFVHAAVVGQSYPDDFVRMRVPEGNSAASSALESWNHGLRGPNLESAPARTLDEILDSCRWLGTPQLVKLDVEGLEAQVLDGARVAITAFEPIFLLEWAPEYLDDPMGDWNSISRHLEGYSFFSLAGKTHRSDGIWQCRLRLSPLDLAVRNENILAVPSTVPGTWWGDLLESLTRGVTVPLSRGRSADV